MTSNLEITVFNHLLSYKYFVKNFLLIITTCDLNFRIDYLEPISKQVVHNNTKLVTCLVLKHTNIHTVWSWACRSGSRFPFSLHIP